MPDEYASVATDDGLTVSSNSESKEEMEEILEVKPAEAATTEPPVSEAKSPEPTESKQVASDDDRDEKGRFKAKPIPDKEETKAEAKPDEKVEAKPAEPEEEDKKKSRPGRLDARQRVEQATRVAAEERRQREAAQRENQALRQALEARSAPPKAEEKPTGDAYPELTEGKDPQEFVRETAEWAAKKAQHNADQARQKQEHVARFQQEADRIGDSVATAFEETLKTDPDLRERLDPRIMALEVPWKLQPGQQPTAWNFIAAEIATSPIPIEVMLHLSEHEDEIQRFATLRPRELTRAFAKLEGKLEAATAGTPAPEIPPYTPSAAQPVTPVTGAATTASGPPDPETTSVEDWAKYYNEKDRKSRRA